MNNIDILIYILSKYNKKIFIVDKSTKGELINNIIIKKGIEKILFSVDTEYDKRDNTIKEISDICIYASKVYKPDYFICIARKPKNITYNFKDGFIYSIYERETNSCYKYIRCVSKFNKNRINIIVEDIFNSFLNDVILKIDPDRCLLSDEQKCKIIEAYHTLDSESLNNMIDRLPDVYVRNAIKEYLDTLRNQNEQSKTLIKMKNLQNY